MGEEQKQTFINRCDGETRSPRSVSVSSRLFSIILWSTLGVSLLLAFLYFLFFSSFFKVSSISVHGLRTVSDRALVSAVSREGISHGVSALIGPENYFFWRSRGSSSMLSNLIPSVEGVVVDKHLRDRSVLISGIERKPFGVWCPELTDCVVFDESGIAFAYVDAPLGPLIVRVDDDNEHAIILGTSVFSSPSVRDAFIGAITAVRESGFPIIRIHVSSSELREWEIDSVPFSMRFSFDSVPEDLHSVLSDLSSRSDLGRLTYVDFRVPGRVYYR